MYICLCKAITDSQIRKAVGEGACSMRELRQRLGVASQCGRCSQCAQSLLRQTLKATSHDIRLQGDQPSLMLGSSQIRFGVPQTHCRASKGVHHEG